MNNSEEQNKAIRQKIHTIIFEADTPVGKLFDVVLMIAIIISVLLVMLESIESYHNRFGNLFYYLEFFFTILFTIEYALRIYSVYQPKKYITSFFGIIDLLSILPFYISLMIGGAQSLMVIRGLRLLRVFRVFKLGQFLFEGERLMRAMRNSRDKILVFLTTVILLIFIFGSLMYLVEGPNNEGFDSIPRSIYWAVVTLTTVGYGDITPHTPLGQFIASVIMVAGYAIIAVPTGIVTSEVMNVDKKNRKVTTQVCQNCLRAGHDVDAEFCKFCGESLKLEKSDKNV